MKILFTTNVPSPYRVDFFNELGKLCDLTVLFEKTTSSERDKSWSNYKFKNFQGIFLKGISISTDKAWCHGFKKYLKDKSYDAIVCCNYSSPTGMSMIHYMRRHKIRYFLEGDGGFAKSGKGFKENVKRHFLKEAYGYFSTAKAHDEYYLMYGAKPGKLNRYPFTSLFECDIIQSLPTKDEKLALREELGLKEEKIVVSVGRFIPVKGFDVAINSFKYLADDVGMYLIGGTPTDEFLNLKERQKTDKIHFVDFMDKESLKRYYKAADLLIMPTRGDVWGLVINEAMANGLPIVSSDCCVAALELVKEGVNGYIVPVDNEKALAEAINKVLEDEEKKLQMSKSSLEIIKAYTLENMAKRHIEVFEQYLKD